MALMPHLGSEKTAKRGLGTPVSMPVCPCQLTDEL